MADKSMLNDIPQASAAGLVADLATKATDPAILSIDTDGLDAGLPLSIPVGFDRNTQRAFSLKPLLEEMRYQPARHKGTAKVSTLASFIDLVNRHKDDHSAIFAQTSWPGPKLTAVLNYNTAAEPRWNDHRVVYDFPVTEELTAWIDKSGKAMDQVSFAAFMEEHAAELAAPFDGEVTEYEALFKERFATPSEVLALSRHLEVYVGAKAKQGIRLQTGERVVEFTEEHMNGKGEKIEVPGVFMVSVPAFLSGDPVRIPARLRYRISGGDIAWFYQLYRWEFWLRTAVQQDLREAGKATELPTFEGSPEV